MNEQRNMEDRRISEESRIQMLEYKYQQLELSLIKELDKASDATQNVVDVLVDIQQDVNKIKVEQAKTQTIIGGATFVITGAVSFAWYVIQSLFSKITHM